MTETGPQVELRADDPRLVGRYRVLRRLGSGGMGTVYLADGGTGLVALKIVRPELGDDAAFRTRFRREVQACFRVTSASTARLLDFDTEADQPWMAVEYVDGWPLDRIVETHGSLPPDQQLALAHGLAEALVAMHAAGVVHRDLKPANVLCPSTGPKVIDFGIAAAADAARLTGTGLMVGSPGWLAPEQVRGDEIGPATDVFTFGLLLCFAASGQPPYGTGPTQALLHRAMTSPPFLDRDRMLPALVPLVERATSFDPRYRPSARELLDELRRVAPAAPSAPPPPVVPPPPVAPGAPGAPTFAPPGPWTAGTHASAGPSYPPTLSDPSLGSGPDRPRPRWLVPLAVVAAVVLVGGATGLAVASVHGSGSPAAARATLPPAGAGPASPSASPSFGAPVGRYSGTTDQGQPISFVVSPAGEVGTVNFLEKVTCNNLPGERPEVPFTGLPTTKGPLDANGLFSIDVRLPEQTFRMTGNYSDGSFVGAFRHVYNGDESGNLTLGTSAGRCDSDQITFRVTR